MSRRNSKVVAIWLKGHGSSPGNNLLCKKQGKAAYNTPNGGTLFPDPAYIGALVHRAALLMYSRIFIVSLEIEKWNTRNERAEPLINLIKEKSEALIKYIGLCLNVSYIWQEETKLLLKIAILILEITKRLPKRT